jgi:N-methylhydantoinase B
VIDRYGLVDFRRLSDELADYSERLTRATIGRLRDGVYEAVDFLDDDGVGFDALSIRCLLTVAGEEMTLDFTGTSAPCAGPVNSPVGASTSAVFIALMHMFPDLPINSGTFRPVRVRIPEGTFLAATYPSPVSGCASEVPSRVIDVVMAAVGKAEPHLAQGGSASTSVNFTLHGHDGDREYIMYFFAGGGYGAYDGSDGLSNASSSISMAKVPPIELLEEWYPIRFERYELRDGSGGDGEFRGGLGAEYVVRINSEGATASFLGDRGKYAPLGIAGGADGATTAIRIVRADGSVYAPPHVSKDQDIDVADGDRIWVRMPGGAGYGDPARRSRDARERDARSGFDVDLHETLA